MAVDSRGGASERRDGRAHLRARTPGNSAARKPPAAPGSPRAHWCADAAQQQLARRPGGASRSTRQEKQRRRRAHRGLAWGLQRMCSPAIAAWSDGLSRSTHVQIASWVTALRRLCVMASCRVSRAVPVAATALRLSEQVQGILDAVRAVYGGTVVCSAAPGFFALFFFIAAISRRRDASDAIHYATSRTQATSNHPQTPPPRRRDAEKDARARSETTATPPLRPGCPGAQNRNTQKQP